MKIFLSIICSLAIIQSVTYDVCLVFKVVIMVVLDHHPLTGSKILSHDFMALIFLKYHEFSLAIMPR